MSENNININNAITMETEPFIDILHKRYDNTYIPEEINGPEDLDHITRTIAWSTNEKAYLNTILLYLDVATRNAKREKRKDDADNLICKKTIVKGYYDVIDDIGKAVSRQASIYFEKRKELAEDRRKDNVQKAEGYDEFVL